MKRLAAILFNPGADEPTAGFRGVLCILIACISPLVMDWNTWFFPLLIAMLGGIGFGRLDWESMGTSGSNTLTVQSEGVSSAG